MSASDDTAADRALAAGIAARRGGIDVRKLAHGSNNDIYVASGPSGTFVVKLSKPHREDGALGEYRKEAWCTGRARTRGVPTPDVLDVGIEAGRAFAVLAFVDGRHPTSAEHASTWQALGRYARSINEIPVAGWGVHLAADGVFGENWRAHLEYNIGALTAGDELLARGIFGAAASRKLRGEFERLLRTDFKFGLCHSDITLRNTLIDGGGKPWLLDWGSAAAAVVPHYEINEILRSAQASPRSLEAFLDGYGLSAGAYAAMDSDLRALAALREVDTLRWAIDRKPDMIAPLSVSARAVVAQIG
jgi:Ser/Thr protein kinase RdoA (MazF antagonist)